MMSSGEEVVIDLLNVPLKPLGKREIQQLEIALIIGTLYRPEVLELIRDPAERATWMDSLAVAAAAFARHKAGVPVTQIAEELGRSEHSIRNHINEKTKAGKLVAETYEKLKRGELRLVVPFIKAPAAQPSEEFKVLRDELEKLKEEKRSLEERVRSLQQELETKLRELESLRGEVRAKEEELEKLRSRLGSVVGEVKTIKELAERVINTVGEVLK